MQQEILRERAAVLGRAGESVDQTLFKLRNLEQSIEGQCLELDRLGRGHRHHAFYDPLVFRRKIIKQINENIYYYNSLREYAQLRYHYLIITREALGLRRHQRVEEIYAIPPKIRYLREV